MIDSSVIQQCIEMLSHHDSEHFAKTRDVFSARLDSYIAKTGKYLEAAAIGELGNNAFDHNFNFNQTFERGVYFDTQFLGGYTVIADFGRGLLDSLRRVKPQLKNDEEAMRTAFLERISGRFPEQRGNGLKFVLETAVANKWSIFYKSGTANVNFSDGTYTFGSCRQPYQGCLVIIHF